MIGPIEHASTPGRESTTLLPKHWPRMSRPLSCWRCSSTPMTRGRLLGKYGLGGDDGRPPRLGSSTRSNGDHMAAYRNSPTPRRAKNDLVLGVGSHAYVNWSPPVGEPRRPVPMIDAAGTPVDNDLADGQEVEIVSWRPRSRDGLSY